MANIGTIQILNNTYEMKDTNVYSLFAPDYSTSSKYKVGDYCTYNYSFYKCKTAINTGENFDNSKWDLISTTLEFSNINSVLESVL